MGKTASVTFLFSIQKPAAACGPAAGAARRFQLHLMSCMQAAQSQVQQVELLSADFVHTYSEVN